MEPSYLFEEFWFGDIEKQITQHTTVRLRVCTTAVKTNTHTHPRPTHIHIPPQSSAVGEANPDVLREYIDNPFHSRAPRLVFGGSAFAPQLSRGLMGYRPSWSLL